MYAGQNKAITGSVLNKSQARKLGTQQTVEMTRILKINSGDQMQLAFCGTKVAFCHLGSSKPRWQNAVGFSEEFRYLGHVMTADYQDMDIKKLFRRQNAVGNMPVKKFSFASTQGKIQ